MDVGWDAVYTAQKIGSYKPDLRNFEFLIEHVGEDLGVKKEEILHTAQSELSPPDTLESELDEKDLENM